MACVGWCNTVVYELVIFGLFLGFENLFDFWFSGRSGGICCFQGFVILFFGFCGFAVFACLLFLVLLMQLWLSLRFVELL